MAPRHWIINGCALRPPPRRLPAYGKAFAVPFGLPTPKAPRHWIINGFALGSCARSLAVRAPVRAPKEEGPSPLDQQWLCPWIVRTQFSSARPVRAPKEEGSPPLDQQWLYPWIVRTQFSSARPVRAPKEVQCFAIGQSRRTNGEVVEWASKDWPKGSPFTSQ